MAIKTFRARTMSEALAMVKRELGGNAVVLHTRTDRVGGFFGIGAQSVTEITATTQIRQPPRPFPETAQDLPRVPSPAPIARTDQDNAKRRLLALARSRGITADDSDRTTTTEPATDRSPLPPQKAAATYTPAAARRVPSPIEHETPAAAGGEATPTRPGPLRLTSSESDATATAPVKRSARAVASAVLDRDTKHSRDEAAPRRNNAAGSDEHHEELANLQSMVEELLTAQRTQAAGAMPGPLSACLRDLLEHELSAEFAERVTASVRDELKAEELADPTTVRRAVIAALASSVPTLRAMPKGGPQNDGRPLTMALLGPTGVGKTTTIAKIAAAYKLRYGHRVGLITCDTYRIAAVDQLRTYANIIGLPVEVAVSRADMANACAALNLCDVILVDTAGRSQRDESKLEELADLLDAADPHQRHLVLSAATSRGVVKQAADRFARVKPDCLIATKLDEAVCFGAIIDAGRALGVPLSFVTTGQEVPDEIELARPADLAELTLCGTPAVQPEPSGAVA